MSASGMNDFSADWLLAEGRADAATHLKDALQAEVDSGALGAVSRTLLALLPPDLLERTYKIVRDVDLIGLIQAGCCLHHRLISAARAADPTWVELPGVTVTAVFQPSIDVLVNGTRVTSIHFELRLDLQIENLIARVADGHLVELNVGEWTANGVLSSGGRRILWGSAPIHLAARLPLSVRIPLAATGDIDNGSDSGPEE